MNGPLRPSVVCSWASQVTSRTLHHSKCHFGRYHDTYTYHITSKTPSASQPQGAPRGGTRPERPPRHPPAGKTYRLSVEQPQKGHSTEPRLHLFYPRLRPWSPLWSNLVCLISLTRPRPPSGRCCPTCAMAVHAGGLTANSNSSAAH